MAIVDARDGGRRAVQDARGRGGDDAERVETRAGTAEPFESTLASAALLVADGRVAAAVRMFGDALAAAPRGNAGWLVPIEPLLGVRHDRAAWTPVLTMLGTRAS